MPQLSHALKTRSSDILGLGPAQILTAWDTVTIVSGLGYAPLSVILVSKFLTPVVSVRSCFGVSLGGSSFFPVCLPASSPVPGLCPSYQSSVSSRFASVPSPRSLAFRLMASEAQCMFAYPGKCCNDAERTQVRNAYKQVDTIKSAMRMAGSRCGTPFATSIPCNLHWNLHRSLYTLVGDCFRADR